MPFQSTRPVRGATSCRHYRRQGRGHFNPRAPCGARPNQGSKTLTIAAFQSTRPVRGATQRQPVGQGNA